MSAVFTPLRIGDVELKNRIVVSPMCQYSSEDGFANDWHLVHLGTRAVGGAALVFTEAMAVSPEGRISPGDLGIWKDEHIVFLKRITSFISQQHSIPGIQLAHAGRKASKTSPWMGDTLVPISKGGWKTVAPSAIPFSEDSDVPDALTKQGICKVLDDFKQATIRADKCGFKVIEIHAAHGYLIHEFLSPLSNQRADEYGGSFENRVRLLLETVATVRSAWPAPKPLFVRISATDWTEGGWDIDDSVRLAAFLKSNGVDLVDCSSGAILPGIKIPAKPGYQVPFAERIKKATGIMTGAVGIIVDPAQAEEIIKSGKADVVFMARQLLREPYFAFRAAKELGFDYSWPVQYERAKR
jgi:2,4-dienoyl-CoA reductase-like NADH-dependent reductase (Old Yellow Enzyme family)